MKKILFFGAGKIGKRLLEFWRAFDVEPDCFVDNNCDLHGQRVDGIAVISLEQALKLEDVTYFVSCAQRDQIVGLLKMEGVSKEYIIEGDLELKSIPYIVHELKKTKMTKYEGLDATFEDSKIIFDLANGLVLGGVEAWSIETANFLESLGYKTYLAENAAKLRILKANTEVLSINPDEGIVRCVKELLCTHSKNIVCNFVGFNFKAACFLKAMYKEKINLIAVIHSDDKIYYDSYTERKEYIDYCVVTCDEMEKLLLSRGWEKNKLVRMIWKIPVIEGTKREYSIEGQPLRIGYAGRITTVAKRMDLLIELVKLLSDNKVDFQLELAGNGNYQEEMEQEIKKLGLESRVKYLGFLERSEINDFWSRQDICLNCSDYEGRCISRAEGMAAGAVPVVTDTSSVKDDVQNGYNGYVVEVGNMHKMSEYICYLYTHRDELALMGRRAKETIRTQNENGNLINMWKKLLENK